MPVRVHLGKLTAFTGIANDFGLLVKRGILGSGTATTIDDSGLAVTDGGVEKVRVGTIGSGDYGLKVRRGVLGSGTETTVDDSGVAVTTGGVERVRLGALGGSDYGLKVVNAGTTVIIDGTSNMFKIVASGTFNSPSNGGAAGVFTSTLDIAGSFAEAPSTIAFYNAGGVGSPKILPYLVFDHFTGLTIDHWELSISIVNTDDVRLTCQLRTTRTGTLTARGVRYYVLKEGAI